jgi:hypothetical protein
MEQKLPLSYQITCLILTALFLWAFSIAREPRAWRRLYQSQFASGEDFSVNKNKRLDENIRKHGIRIAMIILVIDVTLFVVGITAPTRKQLEQITPEERNLRLEMQRIQDNAKEGFFR